MSAALPLLTISLMVALNALYVAAEFATIAARRSRVQEAAEAGNRSAAAVLAILRDPKGLDTYVAACQIGITLSSLLAGFFGQSQLTPLLTPYFGDAGQVVAVVIVLLLVTAFQVVLGELLPKTVALRYPERLAMATVAPMQLSLWLFRPLIALYNGSAFALLRRFGVNTEGSHIHVHSPEELEGLYRDSAAGGLIDATERDMLSGALNVEGRVVREIMTPRTRLVTIAAGLSVGEVLPSLTGSAYSRFPVSGDNPDHVVGVVHLRRLFLAAEARPGTRVGEVMEAPLVVSETMEVPRLWQTLREAGRHSAVVANEYGSVSGLVTLEDALEEIFGEVQDEFDHEEEPIVEGDGVLTVRGDVLLEVLQDRYGLALHGDDVDTVSGLVWQELGRLPAVGDTLQRGGVALRVEAMDRRSVQRVSLREVKGERA